MEKLTGKEEIEIKNIVDSLLEYHKPRYAADNLGMTYRRFNSRLDKYNIPGDIGINYEKDMAVVRETISTFENINNMIKSAVPDTRKEKFIYAQKYAQEDDLIQAIVKTKADFMMNGFRVVSSDRSVEAFCNEINRAFNMDSVVHEYAQYASNGSNVPFYTKMIKRDPQEVKILDPKWLEVIPLPVVKDKKPQKAVILHLSDEFKKIYRGSNRAYKDIKMVNEAMKLLPSEYQKALRNRGVGTGRDGIELLERNGDYVELINYTGQRDRLVDPEMTAVFADIRLRMMIRDGDFSIFHHIKHMIHQVQAGSSQIQPGANPLVSAIVNQRLTDAKALKLKNVYKDPEKVMLEITDDTVKHIYNFPDPKVFDFKKYFAVEQRILRWGGIAVILLDGSESNYSGGYIYMKSLIADVKKWRNQLKRTLEDFYYNIAPTTGAGAVKNKIADPRTRPRIRFDNNLMKEPKQILDEVRLMLERGGSVKTACEQLDIPYTVEVARKKEEWEAVKKGEQYLYPIFEPSQSLLVSGVNLPYHKEPQEINPQGEPSGEPGRPIKDGKQVNQDGKPRQPRANSALEAESAIVKKAGSKWYVYSYDGKKKLSKGYDTKKEATKRLKEIE